MVETISREQRLENVVKELASIANVVTFDVQDSGRAFGQILQRQHKTFWILRKED